MSREGDRIRRQRPHRRHYRCLRQGGLHETGSRRDRPSSSGLRRGFANRNRRCAGRDDSTTASTRCRRRRNHPRLASVPCRCLGRDGDLQTGPPSRQSRTRAGSGAERGIDRCGRTGAIHAFDTMTHPIVRARRPPHRGGYVATAADTVRVLRREKRG